jgi:hypothetical protein
MLINKKAELFCKATCRGVKLKSSMSCMKLRNGSDSYKKPVLITAGGKGKLKKQMSGN